MATRGRPRGFDLPTSLDAAMRAFWSAGYDATSIAHLTRAMGIGAPSLYAAFGDKAALFLRAVEHYRQHQGAYADRALAAPGTARDAVEQVLLAAAAMFTEHDSPAGCMVVSSTAAGSPAQAEVWPAVREHRRSQERAVQDRIAADVATGELPPATDVTALARYVVTVLQGLSAQARDGASREDLEAVARLAMHAWPNSTRSDRPT